jgi:two-component system, response regulator PdtaR
MRVLVVEDVFLQRVALVEALEEAGCEVVQAATADAALQQLDQGLSVHAVVTDVQMPGSLDGIALAGIARQRWPDMGIIVLSGQRHPKADELPADARFLAKPVPVPLLLKTLQELLPSQS